MIIGQMIKEYRKIFGFSQEDLADKIFVSRQTISNWETGKAYPDIQIIISLSILFNISLDELIKEDLEEMKMKINDNKARERSDFYTKVMLMSTVLAALSFSLIVVLPKSRLVLLVPLILFIPALWSSFVLEKLKKDNNLKTYKEILAFSQNKERKELEQLKKKRKSTKLIIEKVASVSLYVLLFALIVILSMLFGKFVNGIFFN